MKSQQTQLIFPLSTPLPVAMCSLVHFLLSVSVPLSCYCSLSTMILCQLLHNYHFYGSAFLIDLVALSFKSHPTVAKYVQISLQRCSYNISAHLFITLMRTSFLVSSSCSCCSIFEYAILSYIHQTPHLVINIHHFHA